MSAIWLLFRLQAKGSVRAWWRACKSWHGAARAVATLLFGSLMILPKLIAGLSNPESVTPELTEATRYVIHNIFPMFILAFFFIGLVSPKAVESLDFRPPEIDFLFTLPLRLKELIVYKLLGTVTGAFMLCFVINCFFGAAYLFIPGSFVYGFLRGLIAIFLAMVLIRLLLILNGLVRKSVVQFLFSPLRKCLAILILIVIGFAFYSSAGQMDIKALADDPAVMKDFMQTVIETDAVQTMLVPFRIYSNIILSDTWYVVLGWISLALALNAAVVGMIMRTDSSFLERELHYSQLRVKQMEQTKSIERAFVSTGKVPLGTLPMLPFWGGAGPIAWRQLQTLYRTRKVMLVGLTFYFVLMLMILVGSDNTDSGTQRFLGVTTMVMLLTFVASFTMPLGFNTDVDKMDIFKRLPFSSWQNCCRSASGSRARVGDRPMDDVLCQYVCGIGYVVLLDIGNSDRALFLDCSAKHHELYFASLSKTKG